MRHELRAVLWFFVTVVAALVLAIGVASSARGQARVGSYSASGNGLSFLPVTPSTEMIVSFDGQNRTIKAGDLNSTWLRFDPPATLDDGIAHTHSVQLWSAQVGASWGRHNGNPFPESAISYLYPGHSGADFHGEAVISAVWIGFEHFNYIPDGEGGSIYGGAFTVEMWGHKLASVPEPGTWVLGLFGLLAIAFGRRKIQLHSQLRQVVQANDR